MQRVQRVLSSKRRAYKSPRAREPGHHIGEALPSSVALKKKTASEGIGAREDRSRTAFHSLEKYAQNGRVSGQPSTFF